MVPAPGGVSVSVVPAPWRVTFPEVGQTAVAKEVGKRKQGLWSVKLWV